MNAAAGILTTRGGMTSHAAVVARGMGKTCVVGAGEITVDYGAAEDPRQEARGGRRRLSSRSTARPARSSSAKLPTQPSEVLQVVIDGTLPLEKSRSREAFTRLLSWADARAAPGRARQTPTLRATRAWPARFGARGHRALPHRAHVLRGATASLAVRRDDPGRDAPSAPRGAGEDPARCSARTFSASSGRWGTCPSRSGCSIRRFTSSCPTRSRRYEDCRGAEGPGREGPGARRRAPRVQPDARPPRLPARHHLPGDLRDAGARHLRGGGRGVSAKGSTSNPEIMIPLVGTKSGARQRCAIIVDEMAGEVDRGDRARRSPTRSAR